MAKPPSITFDGYASKCGKIVVLKGTISLYDKYAIIRGIRRVDKMDFKRNNVELKKVVNNLFLAVPEFEKSEYGEDISKELPYEVFGGFALYVREIVCKQSDVNNQISKISEFINSLAELHDPNVDNLLITAFFEVIIDDKGTSGILQKYFTNNSQKLFDEISAFWERKNSRT